MKGAESNQRKHNGWACYCIACLLILPTNMAFWLMTSKYWALGIAAFVVLAVITVGMFVTAESLLVPTVFDVKSKDSRPPVLYLRAFNIDNNVVTEQVDPHLSVTSQNEIQIESFLEPLNAVGPLISIAEPGPGADAGVHKIGAYRGTFATKDWQATVTEWLEQAGMVILAPGVSSGIKWEINEVKKRFALSSVLLFLPPEYNYRKKPEEKRQKDNIAYNSFANLINESFGVELPEFRRALYFIGFDAQGKVVLPHENENRGEDYDNVANELRAQLLSIIKRIRPDINISNYTIYGQFSRRFRFTVAAILFVVIFPASLMLASLFFSY